MIDTLSDIDALLASKYQLVYIDSFEEARLLEHFKSLSKENYNGSHEDEKSETG